MAAAGKEAAGPEGKPLRDTFSACLMTPANGGLHFPPATSQRAARRRSSWPSLRASYLVVYAQCWQEEPAAPPAPSRRETKGVADGALPKANTQTET